MGWLQSFAANVGWKAISGPPRAAFSVDIPPEMLEAFTGGGRIAPRISRSEALQVPAVLRSRNLIAGTLGSLPHTVHGPDRREVNTTYLLGGNIDPDLPNSVMLSLTYEDLLFEGIAWWRVTRFGFHQYPVEAQLVPVGSVHVAQTGSLLPSQQGITPDQPFPANGQVYIDGVPVSDREVIRFDSPNPPLLRHAARAIRACLQLDMAAANYADVPLPMSVFTPKQGQADPGSESDIQEMLNKWEAARKARATAYVDAALDYKPIGWTPQDLQLADSRQHAVLEIARAAGIDPEDLGVSTTTRTYQNAEQRRQDLLDFTLGAYVSAVQDRLSMRDVLPRGYQAKVKFEGFLRSDTKTRYESYEIGERVGAVTRAEVRELEDRPALTPAEEAAVTPAPSPPQLMPSSTQQEADVPAASFTTDTDSVRVQFNSPEVAAAFRVDVAKRTISGLAVPWGKYARNRAGTWLFYRGSLHWANDIGRVKMNRDHDHGHMQMIGRAVRLDDQAVGLDTSFKIARGDEGDKALFSAEDGVADGLSIEIEDIEYDDSPTVAAQHPGVRVVRRARLTGVALTAEPAFDDARVSGVTLSKEKGTSMTATVDEKQKPDDSFDFDGYMKDLGAKMVESQADLTEKFASQFGDALSAGIKTALEDITAPQQSGPESVRAARFQVVYEPPVYAFAGTGHSLVRDAYHAYHQRDRDAAERLRKYEQQTQEMAKLATAALEQARFTPQSTTTAAAIIPPGYRPDLYVSELLKGRPLVNACARGSIDNATPFVVPVFGSGGSTADHVEGTNPSDGSLTLTTKTVSPGGISGRLTLTREIVDSSNPAIDQIALLAMREAYSQQTEGKVYTLLNGANGAGGTITSGLVPSGAQAATFVGTTGTPPALIGGIRSQLAGYPFARFASPSAALMGQNATKILATAADSTGRPIFPSVGAMNTTGLANAVDQAWSVDGLNFVPAWAMTGVAAGDTQIAIWNRSDFWVWESPLLSFRYEEKVGPANIELNVFGYFATALIRPVGLSGIRIT